MMKPKHLILPLVAVALMFASCDNNLVSRAEYDAALSRADSLEARCDSLEFELSDLKHYNEYLEQQLGKAIVVTEEDIVRRDTWSNRVNGWLKEE
jgi:hypothetical protein